MLVKEFNKMIEAIMSPIDAIIPTAILQLSLTGKDLASLVAGLANAQL